MTGLSDLEASDPLGVLHSTRFRRVANRYPRTVAAAYGGDIAAAALASDEEVAERVAGWEIASLGLVPRDWLAIGASEGRDDDLDANTERKKHQ